MACNYCQIRNGYWTVSGEFRERLPVGNKEFAKRNSLVYNSILGGRLIGIGHNKLELYHAAMNLPSPSSINNFVQAQADLLIATTFAAQESMAQATSELKRKHQISNSEYLRTMVSYDGAYQQRSEKSGGGFSRYCFGAATLLRQEKSSEFAPNMQTNTALKQFLTMNFKKDNNGTNQIALPSIHHMHLCSSNRP